MTSDSEDRIHRLLLTLSAHCPALDLTQIKTFLYDICEGAEAAEKERCLSLLAVAHRRLYERKGRGWNATMNELRDEIDIGRQTLFSDSIPTPNQKAPDQ